MKQKPKETGIDKTYKERAEYLSFINPDRKDIYYSIAEFFGENEIPQLKPKTKRK